MKITQVRDHEQKYDCFVDGYFEGEKSYPGFTGKFGDVRTTSNRVTVGLGKREDYTYERAQDACALAIRECQKLNANTVGTSINLKLPGSEPYCVYGFLLGNYRFDTYKSKRDPAIKQLFVKSTAKLSDHVKLAQSVLYVRDLVNLPSNVVTPSYLAAESKKLKKLKVKVRVLEKRRLEKLGFNAFLAVSRGSVELPKFVTMEYGKGDKTIAIVGKGITFDSGGLGLKPAKYMENMKMDMAGAATVIGVMRAIASLRLNVRVIGAFAACENMPGGKSYRPGDIITAYNGKTIEIVHTDAEGRLILADTLSYVNSRYKPDTIIDVATLTGSVISALGEHATGLLTRSDTLAQELITSGERSLDRVWRLPFWPVYDDLLKSEVADVANLSQSMDAGTVQGAVFLNHFVNCKNWAHLDIAGTAWSTRDRYTKRKGATGSGVRLLVDFVHTTSQA